MQMNQEKWIESVLSDILELAPELRSREGDMKRVIRELMKARPEARMDAEFEQKLREELLRRFSAKEEKKKVFAFFKPAFLRTAGGVLTAALNRR